MQSDTTEQKISIVLVDDEPRMHNMVSTILAKADLTEHLESFYDPVAFMEFLKQNTAVPDMVLLDVHFENSGLSGVDILPFIRASHPYLPIVLLTGMEGEVIEEAQDYECIYYIPKPFSPEHLVRMIRFYLGMGRKSGQRTAQLSRELSKHKELVELLKKELAEIEISSWDEARHTMARGGAKACQRIMEILQTVLKNCELMPSFSSDLEKLFDVDFKLFKKAVDTIIRFDLTDFSSPGMNVHRYQCVQHVYSLRLSKKARVFFYQPGQTEKKKLLRLDPEHDTRAMEKWLKDNAETYESR